MRHSTFEKAEIIQLMEKSYLPAKNTLDKHSIQRMLWYR